MPDDPENDLPIEEDIPDPLPSPGQATSARILLEMQLAQVSVQGVRGFLGGVKDDAVASLGGSMSADPFSLGKVLTGWSAVSDKVVGTIADKLAMDPNSGYLTAVERRLKFMKLPTDAYNSAHAVLQAAVNEGWTETQTARSLAKVLDSTTGTVFEGLEKETALTSGMAWEAEAYKIARTEATAAYGESMNNALAADPQAFTKMWVAFNDDKTRPTHAEADGDVVAIDEAFIVGGEALMYPGDPSGSPQETDNCRCVIVDGTTGNELSDDQAEAAPPSEDGSSLAGDLAGLAEGEIASEVSDALFAEEEATALLAEDAVGELGADLELLGGESLTAGSELTGDLVLGTNPMYALNDEAKINCQKCTAAYEMRSRGYDVTAAVGNPGDEKTVGLFSWFRGANVDATRVDVWNSESMKVYGATRDQIAESYPVGARGAVTVNWDLGGAHVFNWERVAGGDGVKFIDAQSSVVYKPGSAMWDKVVGSGDKAPLVVRLDNREFLTSGRSAFLSGKEMVGAVAERTTLVMRRLSDDLSTKEVKLARSKRDWNTIDKMYSQLKADQGGSLDADTAKQYAALREQYQETFHEAEAAIATARSDMAVLNPSAEEAARQNPLRAAINKAVTDSMPDLEDRVGVTLKVQEKAYHAWMAVEQKGDAAISSLRKSEYLSAKAAREKAASDLSEARRMLSDSSSPGSFAVSKVKTVLDAPPPMTLEALSTADMTAVEKLLNESLSFADKKSGLRAEVSRVSFSDKPPRGKVGWKFDNLDSEGRRLGTSERGSLTWNFEIRGRVSVLNPDGELAGVATRVLTKDAVTGEWSVEHSWFKLFDKEAQGSGFATRWNQQAEAWYAKQGITDITLTANIDVGGYAWARAGYDWASPIDSLSVMARVLEAIPTDDPLYASTKAKVDRATRAVLTGDFSSGALPTPYELSRVGYTEGATMWPGKQGMLGSSWNGVKSLVEESAPAGAPPTSVAAAGLRGNDFADALAAPKFPAFDEAKGLIDYLAEGYSRANSDLRLDNLSAATKKMVKSLDRTFKDLPATTADGVTYRGVRSTAWLPDNLLGSTITDNAYLSTTLRPEIAWRFVNERTPVVFEVKVPAGSKVLPVGMSMEEGYTIVSSSGVMSEEAEVLMPRGRKLNVVGDEIRSWQGHGGVRVITVEMAP